MPGSSIPSAPGRFSLPKFPGVFAVLVLVSALAWTAAACGNPVGGVLALVFKVVTSGWMPAVYLMASLGLGVTLHRRLLPAVASRTLALCTGLACMLTLSHLLGWAGLFGGRWGSFVAWLPVVAGCVLVVRPLSAWWEEAKVAPTPSRWWLVVAPALGLMLAAACSTPGWLWASEFGGFDALSYHLELPQEWMAMGRVVPLHHNVYSYLPSYLETAFLHSSLLSFPPREGTEAAWGVGLVGREGQGLIAAQLLHASLGAMAALACGRAVARLATRVLGEGSVRVDDARLAASVAGAMTAGLVAWTPWTVVTGTLAYNEMAVLLMAGGVVMAVVAPMSHTARWCLCALFVGAACGAKLTAVLFLGVPACLALLAVTPLRQVWKPALLGLVVGLLMLAPWMVRNAVDSGNPVFPFAAGLFKNAEGGTGHWSAEQVARFASSHRFSGSVWERLQMAVLASPDPGNPKVEVKRGMTNEQWGWFFYMVPLAVLGLLPRWQGLPRGARAGVVLLLGAVVVQLGLWLFTTHIQARFLLPVLPAAAVLVGLSIALVEAHNLRGGAVIMLVGAQAFFSYNTLAAQNRTSKGGSIPLYGVTMGASERTGEVFARGTPALLETLSPEQWTNLSLKAGTRLLLVGDAAPLYFRNPAAYATTWDVNPMVRALASAPGNPDGVSEYLRAQGYDFVLLNLGEVARYDRSKFLDPRLLPGNMKDWIEKSTAAAHVWNNGSSLLLRPLLPAERDAMRAKPGEAPAAQPPGDH